MLTWEEMNCGLRLPTQQLLWVVWVFSPLYACVVPRPSSGVFSVIPQLI